MQLSIASEISRTDLSGSFFEVCDEARWQLTLADNGVGIPEEDLRRVFEEFQRGPPSEKNQCTGLGLPITKRLVLLLKAKISVSSEVGRGTEFRLRFSRFFSTPTSSAQSSQKD
jgi:signal transduction histidine kinase